MGYLDAIVEVRPVYGEAARFERPAAALFGRGFFQERKAREWHADFTTVFEFDDHLILDATAAERPPRVGEEIHFRLNYGAMLYAMQSPAVDKEYLR